MNIRPFHHRPAGLPGTEFRNVRAAFTRHGEAPPHDRIVAGWLGANGIGPVIDAIDSAAAKGPLTVDTVTSELFAASKRARRIEVRA